MEYLSYLAPFTVNIIRYFVVAGVFFLIFYVWFTSSFKKNKIQKREEKKKTFFREIKQSLQTSVILGVIGMLLIYSPLHDYTKVYEDINDYSIWWIPLSFILAVMIHDTYFYWLHRFMHHPKIYRRFHLEHHKSINPSPWTSYSFNFIEGVLEGMVTPIILFIMPIYPGTFLAFTLFSFIYNVYGHLGYEIAPKWFRKSVLFELMNTSVHHNLHHEKFLGNYGFYFRIWDRIMKTEHPQYVAIYDQLHEKRFKK